MRRILSIFLFFVCALCASETKRESILSRQPTFPKFGKRELKLNAEVVNLVAVSHYSPKALTPELSQQWYEEYFKRLDPQKQYFLASDLDDFRAYEKRLFEKRNHLLRLEFLEKVYLRMLSRVRQYALFSTRCLEQPVDFSVQESVNLDRKKAEWCRTEQELHELWRLNVKNELLIERLEEERLAEKKAEKIAKGEKPEPAPFKRPPVRERLRRLYAQAYERRLEATALEILEGFLSTFTHLFDPHTVYMAPATKEDFDIHLRLSLQGIGATLTQKDSYCEVVSLVPGGPAEREGTLKEGDRIVEVCQDGGEPVNVIDMPLSKIVQKIRGEKGTKVHLTILDANSGETKRVSIVRDEVKLQDAEASSELREIVLPQGGKARVLVLYLPSFYADFAGRSKDPVNYKSSSRDVRRLLEDAIKKQPIDGVVLDFRGNGGGSLDDAVALAGLFFEDGPVVQIKQRTRRQPLTMKDPDARCVYAGPLFVMVDMNSASASEIVAAALQDMKRAVIIGTSTTHGKGTVQSAFDLDRVLRWSNEDEPLGSIKLTMAKFYRINGESTQLSGVRPDIVLPSYQESLEMGEAKLPFAMPWDTIGTSKYKVFTGLEQSLPILKDIAARDSVNSPDFQEYLQDIREFSALQKQKDIPLNYEARKAYRQRSEAITKKIRQLTTQRQKARERGRRQKTSEELEEDKQAKDVILDETLRLLGLFLELQKP